MTALPTAEEAERALHAVLAALVRRITPEEASHLLAELPSLLRARFAGVARGPDRGVTRESIERVVESDLQVGSQRASEIVRRVGLALEQSISAGEIEDVRAQLPTHLRELFPAASAA
jgi:uncharacterized protein (DUF2267 family)